MLKVGLLGLGGIKSFMSPTIHEYLQKNSLKPAEMQDLLGLPNVATKKE